MSKTPYFLYKNIWPWTQYRVHLDRDSPKPYTYSVWFILPPPNSDMAYLSRIKGSISLALDTQIRNVIVTGDFNFNMLSDQTSKTIADICEQFSLYQTIIESTHFTENLSALTNHNSNLIYSGVTEPFLSQETRYHYQVYGIFKFTKHKRKAFSRRFWRYEHDSLRTKVANTD